MLPATWETEIVLARNELSRLRELADQAASEIVELRRAAHNSVATSLVLMATVDRMLASPTIGLKAPPGRQFQVA
jgi:hypothetical protein